MAQKVLVMGESGTGKSTSMRNCDAAITAVVNPVGKPLPFKNHFDMLNNETDARKITKYMKDQAAAGKKIIVVDDFQYILAVPYMNRIKEAGWDKYNDFGANYFEIIDVCKDLPDDVVVVYMTHLETLDNGLTTVKLIGKLLREKITIEGLFTVVLRTGVNEGKYYFYTQNSGKDTVKSPLGMFPSYAIDNDLNYVVDKIRNYYELGDYKSDDEIGQADQAVASDLEKPDAKGRRSRGRKAETATPVKEELPFKETSTDAPVPEVVPEADKSAKRTRKERTTEPTQDEIMDADFYSTQLKEDTYFYDVEHDNYLLKRAGEVVDIKIGGKLVMKQITKEEFGEGVKRLAQRTTNDAQTPAEPLDGAMNPPEQHVRGQRRRRTRS
ncbi:MAG: hypothetical protein ACOYBA_04710 [Coprococcus sp.]|jgi:hypothetical protein